MQEGCDLSVVCLLIGGRGGIGVQACLALTLSVPIVLRLHFSGGLALFRVTHMIPWWLSW